ncbi:sulfatase-like hydrolase/transferase, partial [Pseudomonas aeruginosa]|uniref:sulfatase-like hydrolase/transferase n=1 Tax=Pseudomonas aeruginosa TaxID=287 RepID=UPI0031B6FD5D
INWLGRYAQEDNRWFSWVSFNGTNIDDSNQQAFARKYSRAAGNVDDQINRVLNALRDSGKLDNTVVIITAGRDELIDRRTGGSEELFLAGRVHQGQRLSL